MPSYSTIVLALSGAAFAAPLAVVNTNTCGVAPSASISNVKTPLETLSSAKTAKECLTACEGNNSCKSFIFGLVDGTIKCQIFDCLAAQIPKQDNNNLVAFDKACSSVPDVQPTTANPQGLATSGSNTNAQTGNEKTGEQTNGQANGQTSGQASNSNTSVSQKKTEVASSTDDSATKVKQEQAAAAKVSQKAESYDNKNAPKQTQVASPTGESATKVKQEQAAAAKVSQKASESYDSKNQQSESKQTTSNTQTTTESKKCAAAPVGTSTDIQPFNTPSNIASLDSCVAACKKNSTCKSCAFGQVATNGAKICRFFTVPAAQIPKATSGQSFQVSDNSC